MRFWDDFFSWFKPKPSNDEKFPSSGANSTKDESSPSTNETVFGNTFITPTAQVYAEPTAFDNTFLISGILVLILLVIISIFIYQTRKRNRRKSQLRNDAVAVEDEGIYSVPEEYPYTPEMSRNIMIVDDDGDENEEPVYAVCKKNTTSE